MTATKNEKGWAVWDNTEGDFWVYDGGEVLWETKDMAVGRVKRLYPDGPPKGRFTVMHATITQDLEYPEAEL